jgi:hypothetical protein
VNAQDVYNSANNQLTIPIVTVGNTTYTNVVVTVKDVISIGGTVNNSAPTNNNNGAYTFNLLSGYQRLIASGYTKKWNISGTCSGTLSENVSPAQTGATWNGKGAYSVNKASTAVYTNCNPANVAGTAVTYYDINYMPYGNYINGSISTSYISTKIFPTVAKVGDSGQIGNTTEYPTYPYGTHSGNYSWVIEADSSNTAIFNVISNITDTNLGTDNSYIGQTRFRINADSTLTPLSRTLSYTSQNLNLTFN